MKKLLFISILVLTGCPVQKPQQKTMVHVALEDRYRVSTVVVKGHDYLVFEYDGNHAQYNPILHDPECRYCQKKKDK